MSSIQDTSAATVLSSDHGRMRRAQRLIDKRDLQAAVRYGTRKKSYNQRGILGWKYTYADIVYITDETSRHEITSWAIPGAGLDVEKHGISANMRLAHASACQRISNDTASWTSHTVIVVDQSGSMRKTDVEGGATRSDAVWLTLAVDFVAKQIEAKESSDTDVVSIVAMGKTDTILVDRQPHDWLLFNTVIDLLRNQEPFFEGNYLPALDASETLFLSNTYGSCALTLFFLSDGRPSDELPAGTYGGAASLMETRIDSLASRFGRRLSVFTVGFAGPYEDFSVLEKMAGRPAQFQSNGRFLAACLNPEALGNAFSSITSSLNQTRSELTAIGGSHQRAVRDVRRRALDTVGRDMMPTENWFTYGRESWQRERLVYSHKNPYHRKFDTMPPLNDSASGVALTDDFFGEGAERLVREFREIGPNGLFVGEKLVAKESRFQDVAHTGRKQIENFHRTFCDTQERAQLLAQVFNKRLERIPGYDPKSTPKISFLDCSVYIVQDRNLGEMGVLVEKQLNASKYQKWNDNCGAVNGQSAPEQIGVEGTLSHAPLDVIAESDEEDEDSEDEGEGEQDGEPICLADIPQAFSHFTYRFTRRKLLVCDLQGVLSGTPPLFELTDPVIHFRSRRGKKNVFERTDRGHKGIHDFFRTHKCGSLCRMLNRTWVREVGDQQRSSHLDGLEERVSNFAL